MILTHIFQRFFRFPSCDLALFQALLQGATIGNWESSRVSLSSDFQSTLFDKTSIGSSQEIPLENLSINLFRKFFSELLLGAPA